MTVQRYNIPDKSDPQFADKLVDMIRILFENADKEVKNFTPFSGTPEDKQHGDIWFDSTENKLKINTSEGVKTLKYE